MLRSAASKVMWVGRATVFLVGLAVIIALTVGVVSQASAQNNPNRPAQNVFMLGATNTVNAMSSLVGSVANNAMLLIDNDGGGPALDLQVEPGQAPMKVNSGAKVENLNADTLDGKSDTDFYAAGSKVADSANADKLDGKASDTYLPGELPPGTTISGAYLAQFYATVANQEAFDSVSYGYRLPTTPTVTYIQQGGADPRCPGDYNNPRATPGNLCFYEIEASNAITGGTPIGNGHSGAYVGLQAREAGPAHVLGTWAVTAPLEAP